MLFLEINTSNLLPKKPRNNKVVLYRNYFFDFFFGGFTKTRIANKAIARRVNVHPLFKTLIIVFSMWATTFYA